MPPVLSAFHTEMGTNAYFKELCQLFESGPDMVILHVLSLRVEHYVVKRCIEYRRIIERDVQRGSG